MNWTVNHTMLRDTLAQLYLDRADALRISMQIGLSPATLSFSDKAINNWQEIITKAEAQELLTTLITQALGEYPKNSVLKDALDYFQNRISEPQPMPRVERKPVSMAKPEEISHQQTLLATYRRNLAHYLKQQGALGEAYTPPGVMNGILEARTNIQRIKQILRGWNVPVEDHPDDGDAVTSTATPNPSTPLDRVKLRDLLTTHFNDDELRDLVFEMNWDYENLPGTTKSGKARELIAMSERHQRLPELIGHLKRLRPLVSW